MQVDGISYGIIPDTFNTILSNYLTPLTIVFPNATSPNDPIYTMAYVSAAQDQLNQSALMTLWNGINANTAQGLGLDILSNAVLNLERSDLVPSSCVVQVTIDDIYSTCLIQMTVTVVGGSPPYSIPTGWAASGSVSPSPAYTYLGGPIAISVTGVYYFTVQSTDTSTVVPESAFNGGSSISGLTFTITNPSSALLGAITIQPTWTVTASSLGVNSPVYSLNSPETFIAAGIYNLIVYSQNITTPIYPTQLETPSSTFTQTISGTDYPGITNVTNPNNALLGTPTETDAQFSARRRYYLNVEGQTYYGLEKAIIDLQVPALQSVFIAETISNDTESLSILIVRAEVPSNSSPVVLPTGWTIYVSGTSPSPNYASLQEYTAEPTSGTQYIYVPTFTTDVTTSVAIGSAVSASSPFGTSVTAITNLDPAILNQTETLGHRGYTVYLQYPTLPYSSVLVEIDVSAVGGSPPYYIPIGWEVSGFSTISPYTTQQSYEVETSGTYYVTCYSTDITTAVSASAFSSGAAVSGLTYSSITNPTAAILGGPNPGGFDINDLYLQSIAQTCYAYHPLGTQFYGTGVGATTFTVNTPYAGYTYNVILSPFQITQASVNLEIIYNSDPMDAGFTNGVFNTALLPVLQTQVQQIINDYFLSKTLPTDLVYSINELSEVLQSTYTGIVALVGNSGAQFSFGIPANSSSGLVYLRRSIGYTFNLDITNFNFSAVDKDNL